MKNTRIRLSWYVVIALTALAAFSVYKSMEGVAIAAIGGIMTVTMTYIGGRSYTKSTAMKTDKEDKP